MYQRIITRLVFCIAFLAQVSMGAQENEIKYIFNDPNTQDYIKRIDFVNKKTKAVVNTYDVIENNPYNHLKYPVVGSKLKNKIYDISNISKNEVSYFMSKKKPLSVSDLRPTKARSQIVIWSDIYTAVANILSTFNIDGYVINYHTTTKILDNSGNIIKVFSHLEYADNRPLVSNNGKYYGLSYGGSINPDEDWVTKQGHRIYDIKTEKLLYHVEDDIFDSAILTVTKNNAFAVKHMINEIQDELTIIDIDSGYTLKYLHNRQTEYMNVRQLNDFVSNVRNDIKLKKTLNNRFQINKIDIPQTQ
jgi:hypothetical protein